MKILSLRLKNFKGIKYGLLKKDEITIDFSQLPDGLIAIKGENGAGKTTVIDNMHPYRVMPFRGEQGLADAVSGTAEKEVVFEAGGRTYKSNLTVNAKTREQGASLYLKDEASDWTCLVDGRVSEYDAEIEKIVMPEKLFFLANFRSQNARSFTAYKKSDLKEIFEKLIGLEYLLEIAGKAKENRQRCETGSMAARREMEGLADMLSKITDVEMPDASVMERKAAELDAARERLKALNSLYASLFAEASRLREEKNGLMSSAAAIIAETERKTVDAIDRKDRMLSRINEFKSLVSAEDAINEAAQRLPGLQIKIKESQDSMARASELNTEKSKVSTEQARAEAERKALAKELAQAQDTGKILGEVPCGDEEKEQCVLLSQAIKAAGRIPDIEARIKEKDNEIADAESHMQHLDGEISKLAGISRSETAGRTDSELMREYERVSSLAARLETVKVAKAQIQGLEHEVRENEARLEAELGKGREALMSANKKAGEAGIAAEESEGKAKKAAADINLEDARAKEVLTELEALRLQAQKAQEAIKAKTDIELRLSAIKNELELSDKDMRHWQMLEKGFGRDGLIAYELEVASPAVSEIANALLDVMGGRFSVRFETLRPKKGSKTEYVESFDIRVVDNDIGDEKSLIDLSGGERVWIDDAIARAIGIYLTRSAGSHVATVISDERDGALDEGKKIEYCAMKRKVLELGGYLQEFFISHTPELWDMADAVISIDGSGVDIDIRQGISRGEVKDSALQHVSAATAVPKKAAGKGKAVKRVKKGDTVKLFDEDGEGGEVFYGGSLFPGQGR